VDRNIQKKIESPFAGQEQKGNRQTLMSDAWFSSVSAPESIPFSISGKFYQVTSTIFYASSQQHYFTHYVISKRAEHVNEGI
jgi:hypothetical protein